MASAFQIETGAARGIEPAATTLHLPEEAIYLPDIQTRGMSNAQMETLADSRRELHVGDWARQSLRWGAVSSAETLTLEPVIMDIHTMEPSATHPTTKQLQKRALEFGDKGSIEAMLQLAVLAAEGKIQVEAGKPLIGITSIFIDSGGNPGVLGVERYEDGLWYDGLWLRIHRANPNRQWDPGYRVVVFPRKK